MRQVIAYFTIDEDRAFDEMGDGPISYFERECGWLEQSGIYLKDAAIADTDADDYREVYLVYLARFAFENLGTDNVEPLTYEQFLRQIKEGV